MRNSIFTALCLLLLLPVAAPAAQSKNTPTTITAERMRYDASGQTVVFAGDVHVKRPDFELWAAKITVYLEKKTGGASESPEAKTLGVETGQINRIVAENTVRMRQGIRTGTCGKATYTMADGKVVMEQNPLINDGNGNEIGGRVINFYTREGRSDVVGGVSASFSTTETLESPLTPGRAEGRR